MTPLRAATKAILSRVKTVTGKPVQFMRDDKLALLATLQMARKGTEFPVLRCQPSNHPLNYLITFRNGSVLCLFAILIDPSFHFSPDNRTGKPATALLSIGQSLGRAPMSIHLYRACSTIMPEIARKVLGDSVAHFYPPKG